jgi:hypothetical protein
MSNTIMSSITYELVYLRVNLLFVGLSPAVLLLLLVAGNALLGNKTILANGWTGDIGRKL